MIIFEIFNIDLRLLFICIIDTFGSSYEMLVTLIAKIMEILRIVYAHHYTLDKSDAI